MINEIINLLEKVHIELSRIASGATTTPEDDAGWTLWDLEAALVKLRELQRNQ